MDNSIYLYHFTDRLNIESIKKYGGLYSWGYLEKNKIPIPRPGGDETSRKLDTRHRDLSDYVRLSFCRYHPMRNRLIRNGYNLVLLKIDSSIIGETSLIANQNATKNDVSIISATEYFENNDYSDFLNFEAIDNNGTFTYRSDSYNSQQAEVLIKTKVPLEYILNIDSPEILR